MISSFRHIDVNPQTSSIITYHIRRELTRYCTSPAREEKTSFMLLSMKCRPDFPAPVDPFAEGNAPKCRRTNPRAAIRFLLSCPACNHLVAGNAHPSDTSKFCPDCSNAFCKGKGSGKCCKAYKAFKTKAGKLREYPFPSRMCARDRRHAYRTFDLDVQEPSQEENASGTVSPIGSTFQTAIAEHVSASDRYFYSLLLLDAPLSTAEGADPRENNLF